MNRSLVLAAALALAACQGAPPTEPVASTAPVAGPGATAAAAATAGAPKATPRPEGVAQKGLPPTAGATVRNMAAAGAAGKPGKLLLAMYMIGSDLEDGGAEAVEGDPNKGLAATKDFKEILEAVKGLSPAERANVEVLAGFGGARKAGWKGLKLLDLAGLEKDMADGVIGNGPPGEYLLDKPGADMGELATFQAFLEEVGKRRGDAAKVFLDMWDHGSSFAGLGPDSTTKHLLSPDEIKQALDKTAFKADLIGFDACLMGSLEVVQAVRGHADYMVASEETEPGHGWDYTLWLQQLAKAPTLSSSEVGTTLVDAFLDSPRHAVTNGRTLSLLNLDKAGALLDATDQLGEALAGSVDGSLDAVLDANRGSQKYGSHGKTDDEFARDLEAFATSLATKNPGLAAKARAVGDSLKGCVLYAREDGTKPGSNGVTICSISNTKWVTTGRYNDKTASGPGWYRFVQAVNGVRGKDTTPPALTGETDTRKPVGLQLLQTGFAAGGFQVKVADAVALADVDVVHVVQPDAAKKVFEIVATERAPQIEKGLYYIEPWDGFGLHLTGTEGTKIHVPFKVEEAQGGLYIWVMNGQCNGRDATLRVIVDDKGEVLNTWVVPYDEAEDGTAIIQREQFELAAGDKLAFYHDVVDADRNETRLELGDPVTVGGDAAFSYEKVKGQGLYFAIARDLAGNLDNSEGHLVE